jgi:hypothetical protein
MRSGMAPVHWKGWAVAWAFVFGMIAGAFVGAWFMMTGQVLKGALVFGAFAVVSAIGFIGVASRKGDPVRTVTDYREDAARAQH